MLQSMGSQTVTELIDNSFHLYLSLWGFSGGSAVKNLPVSAGDSGSIPGLGRSPRGGNGKPLQYSCLRNPMDRGAWWATVYNTI